MISFEYFKKDIINITLDNRMTFGYIVETKKGSIGFYSMNDYGEKDYIRIHVYNGYNVEFSRITGNESQWHFAGCENIREFFNFLENHEKNSKKC